MKTKYIYKGEEILHSTFISLCRKIGVNGGRKFTTLEKLQQEANKGNEKAIEKLQTLLYNRFKIKNGKSLCNQRRKTDDCFNQRALCAACDDRSGRTPVR